MSSSALSSLPASARETMTTGDLVQPLLAFYEQAGLALPRMIQVSGADIPEPYRSLLVHKRDMTSTLENFHQQEIHIRVMRRSRDKDAYYREVALLRDNDDLPVEFGAIQINLDRFPESARRNILEERRPLGRILHECKLGHRSSPKCYFRVQSDPLINSALKLEGTHTLYGRRNTLYDAQNLPLAEIVEILPPADPPAGASAE